MRCSRCKHAFFLPHPAHDQASVIEAVVEDAIEHESVAPPGSTQDLRMLPHSDPAGAGAAPAAAADLDFPDDEDDWEFNEDPPPCDDSDDLDGADEPRDSGDPEGVSSGEFGRNPEESGSIDLAHDQFLSDSGEAGMNDLKPAEISTNDLTTSSMCIDTAQPAGVPELEKAPQPESGLKGVREDAFGSVDDFSSLMESEDHEPATAVAEGDDGNNEDPENWDFLGDQTPPMSSGLSPAPQPTGNRVGDKIELVQGRTGPEDSDVQGEWLELESDRRVGAMARIASALAWVAFSGLLSAGVYLGVTGSFDPGVSTPAFVSIGPMRAANVRGQWLETARAGTLYLVVGDLVNPGTEARALGQAVRVSLLGEDGGELDLPPAFAGRDVEFDALRQTSIEDLRVNQRLTALALATREIGPGRSARFAAAFVSLPEEASHFQLQAVETERINELAAGYGVAIPAAFAPIAPDPGVIDPGEGRSTAEVGDPLVP